MKLSLARETLLKPLQMVIGVVEKKQTLPILSNVLLQTRGHDLSIIGTDLEVELIGKATLTEAISNEFNLTIPGRKLIDICKALPEDAPIELYQEKSRVILKSGKSRFTLSMLPAEDFPSTELSENYTEFTIPQDELLYLLQRTYFAMAQQDVRYYLNGLLIEATDQQLRAIATDGHRLALANLQTETSFSHRVQVIIPRKGVMELMRLLENDPTPVVVALSANHLQVKSDHFRYSTKLIDGRFPDYERVIPRKNDKAAIIDREALKRILARSAILCNEKFRGVRFILEHNLLKVQANNTEQEEAHDELMINYDYDPVEVGFNVNYLLDILNVIEADMVRFNFAGPDSSVLIEAEGQNDGCLYVVMPMRI